MTPTELMSRYADDLRFEHRDGSYLVMQVREHSLDLYARMADDRVIATRFGELRVELDDDGPERLSEIRFGQMIEEVVDHELWRGRGWRIVEMEDAFPPLTGPTLIVAMGSMPYQMPWMPM
ncbi:hypothetical protein [Sphingomonas bacterium]|uniref:hypothetical protein n=1 Tax=Sphingomonas bacterium TaxID=1895847 RepID=UPI0015765203|nr:hypothetical protein [Sphingomonas bacterium]